MLSAPAHAISRRAAGVYACSGSRTQGSDGIVLSPCQTSASELARRAAVASPSRASVRSRSTSAARRLRAMRSASRSLVSHPSGTDSASESVSSAQHRSTARLALSRLAARLARVRQHARIASFSPTVAVLLPLAVPIAAGASPAATRRMSLATYARTLVTARTRSVAASSRGRACVRRDAVCGQDAADIFGAFARLLSVGTSGFAIRLILARPECWRRAAGAFYACRAVQTLMASGGAPAQLGARVSCGYMSRSGALIAIAAQLYNLYHKRPAELWLVSYDR